MSTAPDLPSKVTMGLAKTVHRMQERQFAGAVTAALVCRTADGIFVDHTTVGQNAGTGKRMQINTAGLSLLMRCCS